jgi:predicted RNase H-like HicB family nuclease
MKLSVIIRSGEDGFFVAECPALPGCMSQGHTEREALRNIRKAISLWLEVEAEKRTARLPRHVAHENAQMGFFVTLTPPTKPMQNEAASAGFYESPNHGAFPKIQILTIEGLLNGTESPRYPDLSRGAISFKPAKPEKKKGKQGKLL